MKFCKQQQILNWMTVINERHVIKNKKSCIGQTPSSTKRISCINIILNNTAYSTEGVEMMPLPGSKSIFSVMRSLPLRDLLNLKV